MYKIALAKSQIWTLTNATRFAHVYKFAFAKS